VLRLDGMTLAESTPICEYLEDKYPEPALLPKAHEGRYEVRRLVGWFDDKFHNEVSSKLLYERVNKKVMGQGFPDSSNVKAGAKAIKFHLDYMAWLLDRRRWLAGGRDDARRFRRRRAPFQPRLYLGRGLEPLRSGQGLVRQDQVAPGLPQHPGRPGAGFPAAGALCRP
jgi:hypothetical protein